VYAGEVFCLKGFRLFEGFEEFGKFERFGFFEEFERLIKQYLMICKKD